MSPYCWAGCAAVWRLLYRGGRGSMLWVGNSPPAVGRGLGVRSDPAGDPAMQGPVYTELAPVRQRQQRVFAVRAVALGLLAGSLAAISLELARRLAEWPLSPWLAVAVLIAGPLAGAVAGF